MIKDTVYCTAVMVGTWVVSYTVEPEFTVWMARFMHAVVMKLLCITI